MNEHEVSKLDSIKKCPACEGELERGYAIGASNGAFTWDTKKHAFKWGKNLPGKYPLFTNTNYPAKRCYQCHIIILDYEMKE